METNLQESYDIEVFVTNVLRRYARKVDIRKADAFNSAFKNLSGDEILFKSTNNKNLQKAPNVRQVQVS